MREADGDTVPMPWAGAIICTGIPVSHQEERLYEGDFIFFIVRIIKSLISSQTGDE